jgi:hypothetical protein
MRQGALAGRQFSLTSPGTWPAPQEILPPANNYTCFSFQSSIPGGPSLILNKVISEPSVKEDVDTSN